MSENKDKFWIEFYKKVHDDKKFFAEKGWESIKFHILLASSLISITVGALIAVHTSDVFLGLYNYTRAIFTGFLIILPITMFLVLRIGLKNFKRECKRMYEQASILMKLEERFDFSGERTEKKKEFLKEKMYNPPRYYETKWNLTSSFIDDMLSCCKENFYCTMSRIFKTFMGISIGLIILIIIVALGHIFGIWGVSN
jgi:hypothetical protein